MFLNNSAANFELIVVVYVATVMSFNTFVQGNTSAGNFASLTAFAGNSILGMFGHMNERASIAAFSPCWPSAFSPSPMRVLAQVSRVWLTNVNYTCSHNLHFNPLLGQKCLYNNYVSETYFSTRRGSSIP